MGLAACGEPAKPPLPVVGQAPKFTFLDQDAREFGSAQLENKVWIVDFVYTMCAGPCPVMSRNMASLHRSYALDDRVRFVTVTVDPEFDSPRVLKEYAEKQDAKTKQWVFLTSDSASIHNLAYEGFKIGSKDDPIFHSTRFALVDGKSRVRGYYEGTDDEEVARLFSEIARLLEEPS
ncbi:MAG: SCO family protein [Candidatus Hydrogenedentota bacterium]